MKTIVPSVVYTLICGLFAPILLTGCTQDLREDMIQQEQNINSEMNRIQDRTLTTENRLEEISNLLIKMNDNVNENNKYIYSKLDELKTLNIQLSELQAANNQLAKRLDDMDAQTTKRLKVLLDEVLKENQRIIKRIRSVEKDVYGEAAPQPTVEQSSTSSGVDVMESSGDASEYVRHSVKSGENLWIIAQNYGVTMEDIANANKMESISDIIRPGQILIIPVRKE
ncbi:MAG: LysM peptidoglycan-binding domain-containing protein [Candidatus Auribacter fodinae]|uniref:LysM peptidoglycan-binding domain-containing protein n=1 Tax=Candidatus Auribacter fodinae TaxID=2093366 RepID=A0A3A4R4S5_9BACT|nr:MAG: LysM peptidoglycan-binding domain-containing protein [Candidatus Auribacter fodinae]